MFTSSADVFRTRQAVRDLVEVVHTHRAAIERSTQIGPVLFALDDKAVERGLLPSGQDSIVSDLLFGAATPDDDFNGFIGSTALLIADRLQGGIGQDDLFWNWDAFREHYNLAEPHVRAALMNGFRTIQVFGLANLDNPPTDVECVTLVPEDITPDLQSSEFAIMRHALSNDVSAREAGQLWARAATAALPWPLAAGFRYLYERPQSIVPDDPEKSALIPWALRDV